MPPIANELKAGGSPPRASGSPIERLHRYLERLGGSEFYGKVIVAFQNGKVQDIKVEQTKKLEEL
jgi:hypothetical protein